MINNRTMGEKEGYWTGLEIEHTQFYGDPTVFFSRLETAIAYHEHIFRFEMKLCEHVFLAVINPKFFQVAGRIPNPVDFGQVLGVARWHLNLGRRVTVEDWAINASLYTDLRIAYNSSFCFLGVVEIPKVQAGAFAIKVAPRTVFQPIPYEGGVGVTTSEDLRWSLWHDYEKDIDGTY